MQTRHLCRSHLSMIATFLVAAAFVIAAPSLRAADPSDPQHAADGKIETDQESDRARNREVALAAPTPTPPVLFAVAPTGAEPLRHSPRVAEVHLEASPFGYLEFDWNAGVPGFGPLSSGAADLGALSEASRRDEGRRSQATK
jgi:hypothetical protein